MVPGFPYPLLAAWVPLPNKVSCFVKKEKKKNKQLVALEPRLRSCAAWAQLLHGVWALLGSGIEPLSPALAEGFFTTEPPGKPTFTLIITRLFVSRGV